MSVNTSVRPVAPQYEYTSLADLTNTSSRVNVWGVVKFFKEPQRSRGSDFFQTFSIVGDSLDPGDPSAKLVCVLFNADISNLPTIKKIGDIVRLHRVNIQNSRNLENAQTDSHPISKLQAITTHGFSWVAVDGDANASMQPRSNSRTFTWTSADVKRATELKKWFIENHGTSLQQSITNSPKKAVDISVHSVEKEKIDKTTTFDSVLLNAYFNSVAFVVGIGSKSMSRCILFVTDSSQISKRTSKLLPPLFSMEPFEVEELNISNDLFDSFRGEIATVIVYDDHCASAQALKPGDVVFLKNLHCVASKNSGNTFVSLTGNRQTILEVVLHGKTHFGRGLRKLSPEEVKASGLPEQLDNLKKVLAAQRYVNEEANEANRSFADRSIGPFEGISMKSSHLISPEKDLEGSRTKDVEENLINTDDTDEWETVCMRDVAIQTNLP